jgi:two-component system, OmpR family, phosphate regulon sensor histidine kinase PhoR
MQQNYSAKTRLILSFCIVLLMALLLPPWYYYRILAGEVMDETQKNAIQQLNVVDWMLSREENIRIPVGQEQSRTRTDSNVTLR